MVRSIRARRAATAAAVVLAATLGASGCGGQDPSAAAVINGQVIPERAVEAVSHDVAALRTGGQDISKQDILITLVLHPLVMEAAQRSGTMVSESEARTALGAGIANPSPATVEFAQTSLLSRRLSQAELAKVADAFKNANITVNPRYGAIDPTKGIVPVTQNWMDPAAAGTAGR